MTEIDVQVFPANGVWFKPDRAVRTDIVLQGGDGGAGEPGSVFTGSFSADELPDTVEVAIGDGGLPAGTDGYALVVTVLRGT